MISFKGKDLSIQLLCPGLPEHMHCYIPLNKLVFRKGYDLLPNGYSVFIDSMKNVIRDNFAKEPSVMRKYLKFLSDDYFNISFLDVATLKPVWLLPEELPEFCHEMLNEHIRPCVFIEFYEIPRSFEDKVYVVAARKLQTVVNAKLHLNTRKDKCLTTSKKSASEDSAETNNISVSEQAEAKMTSTKIPFKKAKITIQINLPGHGDDAICQTKLNNFLDKNGEAFRDKGEQFIKTTFTDCIKHHMKRHPRLTNFLKLVEDNDFKILHFEHQIRNFIQLQFKDLPEFCIDKIDEGVNPSIHIKFYDDIEELTTTLRPPPTPVVETTTPPELPPSPDTPDSHTSEEDIIIPPLTPDPKTPAEVTKEQWLSAETATNSTLKKKRNADLVLNIDKVETIDKEKLRKDSDHDKTDKRAKIGAIYNLVVAKLLADTFSPTEKTHSKNSIDTAKCDQRQTMWKYKSYYDGIFKMLRMKTICNLNTSLTTMNAENNANQSSTIHITAASFFQTSVASLASGLGTISARNFAAKNVCPFLKELLETLKMTEKISTTQTRLPGNIGFDAYCKDVVKMYNLRNTTTGGIYLFEMVSEQIEMREVEHGKFKSDTLEGESQHRINDMHFRSKQRVLFEYINLVKLTKWSSLAPNFVFISKTALEIGEGDIWDCVQIHKKEDVFESERHDKFVFIKQDKFFEKLYIKDYTPIVYGQDFDLLILKQHIRKNLMERIRVVFARKEMSDYIEMKIRSVDMNREISPSSIKRKTETRNGVAIDTGIFSKKLPSILMNYETTTNESEPSMYALMMDVKVHNHTEDTNVRKLIIISHHKSNDKKFSDGWYYSHFIRTAVRVVNNLFRKYHKMVL